MVEASTLVEVRDLLDRALKLVDEIGDPYQGALIDTALQDATHKVEALKSGYDG